MKISISNIAWRSEEEPAVAAAMQGLGITGVEVAPGKIGPEPAAIDDDELRGYREVWSRSGISIVAMQALLFGRGELVMFGSDAEREQLLAYFGRIIHLGGVLGAKTLVFGSPKNRQVGDRPPLEACEIAVRFFRSVGRLAADHGTCFCIEPNPPEYGCDFITNARDALALVRAVDHPGFGLHLDAAALHMAGEGAEVIRESAGTIRHFHASEPMLAQVKPGGAVDHESFARALREIDYARWISIEMRQQSDDVDHLPIVDETLRFVTGVYGD